MGPDEDQFDNGWKDCMSWYFVCDGTWRMLLLVGMGLELCRTKCGRRYGKRESMGVNKDRKRRNGQKGKVYWSCLKTVSRIRSHIKPAGT